MANNSLSDIVRRTLTSEVKNIEPVKRMCGGWGPRYVRHRFPIKGGVSAIDLLAESVMQNNALYSRVKNGLSQFISRE